MSPMQAQAPVSRRRSAVFSVSVLVALIAAAFAQAGSAGKLDPSFGHRGRVVLSNANGTATAR
jgi:hypothetical protein